ncbi:MAG TPA: hypothetical protein VI757_14980 [Bacteroidia bacterium]|nr:hypothetical protein [Bacteroidia bacterium]
MPRVQAGFAINSMNPAEALRPGCRTQPFTGTAIIAGRSAKKTFALIHV